MTVNTTSDTGLITTSAGIVLPTTGGTAGTLDVYEENTAVTLTLSGPWASSRSFPVTFTMIGNRVTMSWGDLSPVAVTATTTPITSSTGTLIPTRFLAASRIPSKTIPVYSGSGGGTMAQAVLSGGNTTNRYIDIAINFTGFGAGSAGFPAGDHTWTV
jgi:hypothetical protein